MADMMSRNFQKWALMFDSNIKSQAENSKVLLKDFRSEITQEADQLRKHQEQQMDQLLVLGSEAESKTKQFLVSKSMMCSLATSRTCVPQHLKHLRSRVEITKGTRSLSRHIMFYSKMCNPFYPRVPQCFENSRRQTSVSRTTSSNRPLIDGNKTRDK